MNVILQIKVDKLISNMTLQIKVNKLISKER